MQGLPAFGSRRLVAALSLSLGLAVVATPAAAGAGIDVMTQNQYLGADLAPVIVAAQSGDPVVFSAAVVGALSKIAATRPAARVRALSNLILQRRADVVALQEAYEFTCAPLAAAQPVNPCDDPQLRPAFTNHLTDTLQALGADYALAARVTNLKVDGIPFTLDGIHYAVMGLADRDAILVRRPWPSTVVALACLLPSDDGCNYLTRPDPLNLLGTPVDIHRGYVAVDVRVRDRDYRVFNTHLEQRELLPGLAESRVLQVGQTYELLQAALGSAYDPARTLVVMGDFNADPDDLIPVPPYPPTLPSPPFAPGLPMATPYQILAGAGLVDAWTRHPWARPGDTCCQDEGLSNLKSGLYERIDLIWVMPPLGTPAASVRVADVRRLGVLPSDKLWMPRVGTLWPSDHASLAARVSSEP